MLVNLAEKARKYALSGTIVVHVIALVTLILLARRAGSGIDVAWDGIAYHLPWAARTAGVCTENCYYMSKWFEDWWPGMPLAAETFQGLLWKLTGSPIGASFMNLIWVVLLPLYLWHSFRTPLAITFLALLAIPMLQIHATTLYIDAASGISLSIALLSVYHLIMRPRNFTIDKVIIFAAAAAFAGNAKMQNWPALGVVFAVAFFWLLIAPPVAIGPYNVGKSRRPLVLGVCLLIGAVAFGTVLRNIIVHHNPVFPVTIGALGLPGIYETEEFSQIGNRWKDFPTPIRFIASVLEFGGYSPRENNWTLDSGGAGTHPDAWLYRMGGFFGAYVMATIGLLAGGLSLRPTRERLWTAGAVIGFTVLTAFCPQSHDLRYYMYWMITLVSLTLVINTGNGGWDSEGGKLLSGLSKWNAVAFFIAVICITHLVFLTTPLTSISDAVAMSGSSPIITSQVSVGEKVCIQGHDPLVFLYSSPFHEVGPYQLVYSGADPSCDVVIPP